eukprot:gene1325-32681_t
MASMLTRLGLSGMKQSARLLPVLSATAEKSLASHFRALSSAAQAEAKPSSPHPLPPPPPSAKAASMVINSVLFGSLAAAGLFSYALFNSEMPENGRLVPAASPAAKDYNTVREAIADILDAPPATKDYNTVRGAIADILDVEGYDDGSYGPLLVRLAWHSAGSWDKATCTGGSNGATMRFSPECEFSANAGLARARVLSRVYGDLWTLAGAVAVEEMGGPHIPWAPGRVDKPDGSHCPPDGRLPDALKGSPHLREIFGRMGFDDKEIVALSGAHALGRCHTDRSGFVNAWTNAPTTFSNLYFKELMENKWTKKKWSGPLQYEDKSKTLMMLPTDMALVSTYAKDEELFFNDFAAAFGKLLAFGAPQPEGGIPAAA